MSAEILNYATINVYGWDFRLLRDGNIQSRNVAEGKDWSIRNEHTVDIDGAKLWAIRTFLNQLNQIFPREQAHLPKAEPLKEVTAKDPSAPVGA